jgi:hypothetical protein
MKKEPKRGRPAKPKQATPAMVADQIAHAASDRVLRKASGWTDKELTVAGYTLAPHSWPAIGRETPEFWDLILAWKASTGRSLPTGYSTWPWPKLLAWLNANVPLEKS